MIRGVSILDRASIGNFHQPGARRFRNVPLNSDVAGNLADIAPWVLQIAAAVLGVDPACFRVARSSLDHAKNTG
jgi:hypothetical protein